MNPIVEEEPKITKSQQSSDKPIKVNGYDCNKCGEKFRTSSSLRIHQKSHRVQAKETDSYMCSVCRREFDEERSLKCHYSQAHKPGRVLCSYCGKHFVSTVTLNKHIELFHGVFSCKCKFCTDNFNRKQHNNLICAEPETLCECSYCGKRFATPGNLREHVVTHIGQTPFVCGVCEQFFVLQKLLRKHCKEQHGGKGLSVGPGVTNLGDPRHIFIHMGEKQSQELLVHQDEYVFDASRDDIQVLDAVTTMQLPQSDEMAKIKVEIVDLEESTVQECAIGIDESDDE